MIEAAAVFLGFAVLWVFYQVVKTEWPSNYFALSDSQPSM